MTTISELIDAYWDCAYREGAEGRTHDTPNGDAQRIRSQIDAHLAPREVSDEDVLAALTRLYTAGYKAGHHYTVEGGYTDVFHQDAPTYFRDEVTELLLDSDYAALQADRQRRGGVGNATYSQGVLDTGAAILRDGVRMTIDDIVSTLNSKESYRAQRGHVPDFERLMYEFSRRYWRTDKPVVHPRDVEDMRDAWEATISDSPYMEEKENG